nr:mismatch repair protein [Farysia itapuensis]
MEEGEQAPLSVEAEAARSRPIRRLDPSVVNKIAAGEIIHRPANALKELIENSLDAGATMIRITLKEGGIKMLQIQDNGSGVHHADLPLLCERFATSKLRDFEDLSSMSTFGFRGEALASISYVTASMSVISKPRDQECAYKAFYANGALAPPKPGQSSEPKQSAGTDGTLITAEDLFFNVPQRKRALRSAAEEYNRALDVVSKYAVHYGGKGIGFVCRKASSNMTDLNTPSSPSNTTLDTIRQLHGNAVARELVELEPFSNREHGFSCQGWISGANWSSKRTTMLCFINNRLVDCPALKRSMESLYSTLLPKGGHPWTYLSLSIDPANVDVNVHPTKKEVHFLNQDEIVEIIASTAQQRLAGANSSRTFAFSQAVLPVLPSKDSSRSTRPTGSDVEVTENGHDEPRTSRDEFGSIRTRITGPVSASRGYPQHLVRVDAKTRTLDSMFLSTEQEQTRPSAVGEGKKRTIDVDAEDSPSSDIATATSTKKQRGATVRIVDSDCSLTSVRQLRAHIVKAQHRNLTDTVQNHTFVGVVDIQRGLSLIQHETKLLLVNHDAFIEEFGYQLVVRQFGSLKKARLEPTPSIEELVELGLSLLDADGQLNAEHAVSKIVDLLLAHAEMLDEYFSLKLDSEARTVEALPNLIPRASAGIGGADVCAINLDRLPQLLVRLATQVDYSDEQTCFDDCARQIARSCLPMLEADNGSESDAGKRREAEQTSRKIQHLWFDNMAKSRARYTPSKDTNKHVVQVARLPDLCEYSAADLLDEHRLTHYNLQIEYLNVVDGRIVSQLFLGGSRLLALHERFPQQLFPAACESIATKHLDRSLSRRFSYWQGFRVLVHVHDTRQLVRKFFNRQCMKSSRLFVSLARGGGHGNVHPRTGALVTERDKTRCHELDNVDAEMLVLHRAQSDRCFAEILHDLGEWSVDEELDVLVDAQLSC